MQITLSRRAGLTAAALTLALSAMTPVQAQDATADYPAKAITIIVPFAAGGNTDVKTRMVAQQLTTLLGKPVIVDNKPGASGNIGMELLTKAQPDGVVAAAKAKPGSLNIANAGPGGAHHLSAELFEAAAGIDILAVPYKGGGPAANALMAGEVDLMFEQTGAALPSIQAGKIRPLAVTSAKRLPALPDVPSFTELGLPQVAVSNWMGYVAPKGTPPAVVAKLHAAFAKAIAMPEIKERILSQSNELGGGSPADFASFIQSESGKWSKLVKERNIKIE